jgi:Uma2 family endonuclease
MPTPTLSFALQPGEIVTLQPVDWRRFEAVLVELGEKRSARVAYANGVLEIMTPLPEHERAKVTIVRFHHIQTAGNGGWNRA